MFLQQSLLHSSASDSVLFHDRVSISNTTSGPQTPLHHLPVTLPLTQGESMLPPVATQSPKPAADKLLVEPLSPSVGMETMATPAEASTSSSPPVVIKQEIQHEDVTDDEALVKTSTPSPPVTTTATVSGLKPGLEDITDDEADVKPDKIELKTEVKCEVDTDAGGQSPKTVPVLKSEPADSSDGRNFADVKQEVKEESSVVKSSVSDEDGNKSSDISRTSFLDEEGGRKGNNGWTFSFFFHQLI